MATKVRPPVPFKDQCFDCGRRAKWMFINRYSPPKLFCGIHKRGYANVLRLLGDADREQGKR